MGRLKKGDFVELDGKVAVVVGTDDESSVPEEHVLLWYGEPHQVHNSESRSSNRRIEPIAYSVPEEYCKKSLVAKIEH